MYKCDYYNDVRTDFYGCTCTYSTRMYNTCTYSDFVIYAILLLLLSCLLHVDSLLYVV